MTVSGLTISRAERQSRQNLAKAIQNSRSRKRREGRLAVRLRMASCWRRARISAISSRRGAKKEPARKKRRGKRAINEKRDREIQIRKSVSSIRVKVVWTPKTGQVLIKRKKSRKGEPTIQKNRTFKPELT